MHINNPFIINVTSVLREGRLDVVKFKSQGNQDFIQFKFSPAQIICSSGMFSLTRKHWEDISRYINVKQAISIKKYEDDIKKRLSVKRAYAKGRRIQSRYFFTNTH